MEQIFSPSTLVYQTDHIGKDPSPLISIKILIHIQPHPSEIAMIQALKAVIFQHANWPGGPDEAVHLVEDGRLADGLGLHQRLQALAVLGQVVGLVRWQRRIQQLLIQRQCFSFSLGCCFRGLCALETSSSRNLLPSKKLCSCSIPMYIVHWSVLSKQNQF